MIDDEELLLYYYRELEPADRARVAAAISADPRLAQRLHSLGARLDATAALPEVAVPAHVQQRWRGALDRAARGGSRQKAGTRAPFEMPRWRFAAVAAALVAAVVTFQRMRDPVPTVVPPIAATPAPAGDASGSAYERGLRVHLENTERQIETLGHASPQERARLVEVIIAQNRLYSLAAERAGEPQLARVLRAFNPILEDVASGRSESTAADLSQLGFELRVMQARLGAGAPASPNIL